MTTDHRKAIAAELRYVTTRATGLARAAGLGHEAEDIASEVMMIGLRSADRFDGQNVRGWLLAIIVGQIRNCRRHSSFSKTVPLERTGPDGETRLVREPSVGASQETTLQVRELDAALLRLPLEQAEVVRLVTLRGVALDEAARALGLPIGTVKSRVSRGLEALRYQLENGPRTRCLVRESLAPEGRGSPDPRQRARDPALPSSPTPLEGAPR